MAALAQAPALRILAPFVVGIMIQRRWEHSPWIPVVLLAICSVAYLLLNHASQSATNRLKSRPVFIIPLAIAAMSLGWIAAIIHSPARFQSSQSSSKTLTGRVMELQYTDFSMRMTVDLIDSELPPSRVLITTRGCDYTMQAGNLVSWQGQLIELGSMGNPDEMDYASYLLDNKGIRYTQHLPVDQVIKVGYSPTLLTRLANIRRSLSNEVFNSRLAPATQQFIVALTLGDSSLIDKSTRQDFSSAGVAHVLALSGLHVGFIVLIIWWLLFPLDYLRLKKLRLIITLAVIALFALFTGLSPSVVRATIMIAMVFTSVILYRRSVSLNALSLAALLILVFSPSSLYSVGFQLSFITVAAILLFARLPQCLESRFKLVNYFTSTVMTSIVAMLSTIALSAHYFHTISVMSVLSNLLILPALPIFMVLGALFMLITAAGLQFLVLDWALDSIYRYIIMAIKLVNAIPLSHLGGVYVSTIGVAIYFVIMAFIILWLYRRKFLFLLSAVIAFAFLLVHSMWVDAHTSRCGLVIFNSFSSTPVFYYDNGNGYVWTPDDDSPDSVAFTRYHSGFLARHGIDSLKFIAGDDSLRLDQAMIRPPYAHLMGYRIMAVGSGIPVLNSRDFLPSLDLILVTAGYRGPVGQLRQNHRHCRLVLSGALPPSSPPLLPAGHRLDATTCHDLKTHGALTLAPR